MRYVLLVAVVLGGCAIHHVTPYVPDANNAPQTADAVEASGNCVEASAAVESAVCANPALAAPNRAMLLAVHAALRAQNLFGRDAVLAGQRAWLFSLPDSCHLPSPPARSAPEAAACLAAALTGRAAALGTPPSVVAGDDGAIAQYVHLDAAAGAGPQPDPALCEDLSRRSKTALARTGGLDPAAMGAEEVAGTHGQPTGIAGGHHVAVDLYDANAYALFQRRARSLSLDSAPPAITPISLTGLVQARAPANQGGRFSAYASQTGDYGSLDALRLDGRLLALAADPWGSTTPAAPGEAAHAGVWDISGRLPLPACLFDIFTRPAEPGAFASLPAFTRLEVLLSGVRESGKADLDATTTRDQALLEADTVFVLLHMPLLAVSQASDGGWTPWLRHRHDSVLDVLFTWGHADPAHRAIFDQVFAQLRPAATELVQAYQTTQGLTVPEATQAAGLAVMELLYQAVATLAPGLGADPNAPRSATGLRPRYPILAAPH